MHAIGVLSHSDVAARPSNVASKIRSKMPPPMSEKRVAEDLDEVDELLISPAGLVWACS
jgi:hypothetical protein